ncbi:MAG: AMP-binding protein [Alphaproteobacteria bacterium]|nr:AMP-binding protein [Alphaproteobacteria bacterium]
MPGTLVFGRRRIGPEQLAARVARAAGGFKRLGIGAGDGVALLLRNDFAFFEAALAVGRRGGYSVPINWHFKAEEIGHILRDCGAKAVIAHADLLPAMGAPPPGVAVLVVETPDEIAAAYGIVPDACHVPAGATPWEAWLEAATPDTDPPQQIPASIIYTSGTTGRPKGVKRRPAPPGTDATLPIRRQVFGIEPGRVSLLTGPLYHSAPNFFGLYAVRDGGTLVLMPRFDALETLRLVETHKIAAMHLVPTMMVRMMRLPEAERRRFDLSSLRHVVHAAAPCPPEVKRAMIEWLGPIVHEYYGATETGPVVHCTSAEWLAHPGTVGKPLPEATVRIYGEDGKALGANQVGEVFVVLSNYPDFTYNNSPAARAAVARDGLVSVGDVGLLDEDGFLHLRDRKRDMVISGGVNIYPAEIESVLIGLAGVKDCAVFGVPDAEFGEALMAVIELLPGVQLGTAEVRAWLSERLAGYKVPKRIEFQHGLPREDSGKIFKRRLREPYWRAAGRNI